MDRKRERIAAFLQLASEELGVASRIVEQAPRQCAYLLQQAAEKMARAILTAADVPFGPGHDLGQMADALPEDHPWMEKIRALNKHSPAATRYRYPTPEGRLLEPPGARRLAIWCPAPNTEHELRVLSADAGGNGPTASPVVRFRTAALPDATPPVIVGGPKGSR